MSHIHSHYSADSALCGTVSALCGILSALCGTVSALCGQFPSALCGRVFSKAVGEGPAGQAMAGSEFAISHLN